MALHFENGPLELQELRELTPKEIIQRENSTTKYYDVGRKRYDVKVLCRYYDNK